MRRTHLGGTAGAVVGGRTAMVKRKRAAWAACAVAAGSVAMFAWAGVASAVSGGGFNPDQQDCQWNADAWNTPPNSEQPGCHTFTLNVESGGTTNGDPNSNNTRFAEFGVDSLPNNPGNPSTGEEEYLGSPGTPDSPHSGCVAANTDGTGGGTGTGCGNNPLGTGFELNWDYYAIYCPATALIPAAVWSGVPQQEVQDPAGAGLTVAVPPVDPCSANYQPAPGANTPTIDTGPANAFDKIMQQGLLVYLGANDNLDNGEHDGFSGNNHTDGGINGSSDGGALILSLTPQSMLQTPSATHPEGLVNASEGQCADSICAEGTTQQQTVYYGCYDPSNPNTDLWTNNGVDGTTNPQNDPSHVHCEKGTPSSGDVYQNNSPASTQEANGCSSGGPDSSEIACYTNQDGGLNDNPNGANGYRSSTPQQMNAEPGIQTYQDPDPQRSPALPVATPGIYVGTCGVFLQDSGGDGLPGITGMSPGYIVGPTDPTC